MNSKTTAKTTQKKQLKLTQTLLQITIASIVCVMFLFSNSSAVSLLRTRAPELTTFDSSTLTAYAHSRGISRGLAVIQYEFTRLPSSHETVETFTTDDRLEHIYRNRQSIYSRVSVTSLTRYIKTLAPATEHTLISYMWQALPGQEQREYIEMQQNPRSNNGPAKYTILTDANGERKASGVA
jgi:hypothetical protein